jgi:ATP synthase F1 delta subunit
MSRISQRYASALADVVLDRKETAPALQGLSAFVQIWAESAGLRNFLMSPAIPSAAKHGLVDKLAASLELVPAVRNFLHVLIRHRRLEALPEIRVECEDELRRRLGIARAAIVSVRELTEDEKKSLVAALEGVTGKKIEAQYQVNRNLIGGATVRIGSAIYDGSVREQLALLRSRLGADA